MKLPKELTTVTRLSKTLAAILFIALPLVGFFLGTRYQEMLNLVNHQQMEANLAITRAPTPTPDQKSPEIITENFYRLYLECIDLHFRYPTGKSPREDCAYEKYPQLDKSIINTLNNAKGGDPVLCAANIPDPHKVKIDKTATTYNKATIIVHTFYQSSGDNPISVLLEKKNSEWIITKFTCLF